MTPSLFLMTLGPVQDFIAAARRTRDLWAGSKLLSELARTAALELRDTYQAELIFPAPDATDMQIENHDVVNRILARIPTGDSRNIGKQVEEAVRERLKVLCQQTFDDTGRIHWPKDGTNHRVHAEDQVADMIELYWAAVPDSGNYQYDRSQVEAALAACKNTRQFQQPSWAGFVPKSSIDGLRESVIDENEYPDGFNDPKREQKIQRLFDRYGAKVAERLSGVDLFKRHYFPRHIHADFPSTSHFAALPLLARNEGTRNTGIGAYLSALQTQYHEQQGSRRLASLRLDQRFAALNLLNNYDASILFTSRLEEDIEGDALAQARLARDLYLKRALGGAEPEPYYALLHADGDFMGKTIDALADMGIESHRAFSAALGAFASGVRQIVEEQHMGALVYSGGDDVLALLPLHTVVACAKMLADTFATQIGGFSSYDIEGDQTMRPSLSVGIAICHHLEPLSDALHVARTAEKQAKKLPGKNALAITLSKRGTGERMIAGSWSGTFYDRISNLIDLHRANKIPDSAAYDLHDLIERLGTVLPATALKAEAKRMLKRKRGSNGSDQTASDDLLRLADTLPDTYDDRNSWGVMQFANELIVTREFAKAEGFVETLTRQGAGA